MELGPTDLEVGRRKITQVFRYLEALNQLRNPVKRFLEDQPWVLNSAVNQFVRAVVTDPGVTQRLVASR